VKIHELEISNTRGIHHLIIKPNGRNFVIWGPNGSGKSAVVDSFDFLLTGQISRLTGEGTKGITLKKHGPHIDKKPREASVRAILSLHGSRRKIEISRSMDKPGEIFISEESQRQKIVNVMSIATRGQHILTRREILKYITAEAGDRAKRIQALLNISEIEKIRAALVFVKNKASSNIKTISRTIKKAEVQVSNTLDQPSFSKELVLEQINKERKILGGKPISDINHKNVKSEIKLPQTITGDQTLNITLLEVDISNLLVLCLEETQRELGELDRALREALDILKTDTSLTYALDRRELIIKGLDLLDEGGNCPLCGKTWPVGKLEKHLKDHLEQAKTAKKYSNKINSIVSQIQGKLDITIQSLEKIKIATEKVDLFDESKKLDNWNNKLINFGEILDSATKNYLDTKKKDVSHLYSPPELNNLLPLIHSKIKEKYPESSPEQNAWDKLTSLVENLKSLEKEEKAYEKAILTEKRAILLHNNFLEARDKILGELYDSVKIHFIDLYRQLHCSDEGDFAAKIEPDGARLNIEVDFHGRGTFPPHALHSEGHQDSMGLCLFLALSEKLTQGVIDLVILDDVVMSVDSNHRRELCSVLSKSFPDRQFLITTHDKTWANQLRSEGIVDSKSTIEFFNWHIDTGPNVNYEVEMWQRIEKDIEKNDIPSAAARLRRGSEEFFSFVADSLHAEIRFKLDSRWDLGELQLAITRQYKNLLNKAINSAKSWGKTEELDKLKELESIRKQIIARTHQEQWATNANVHFNNWVNFVENDFRPLIDAYQDLHNLFICVNCRNLIHISTKGLKLVDVKCKCGEINWNLEVKPK